MTFPKKFEPERGTFIYGEFIGQTASVNSLLKNNLMPGMEQKTCEHRFGWHRNAVTSSEL